MMQINSEKAAKFLLRFLKKLGLVNLCSLRQFMQQVALQRYAVLQIQPYR